MHWDRACCRQLRRSAPCCVLPLAVFCRRAHGDLITRRFPFYIASAVRCDALLWRAYCRHCALADAAHLSSPASQPHLPLIVYHLPAVRACVHCVTRLPCYAHIALSTFRLFLAFKQGDEPTTTFKRHFALFWRVLRSVALVKRTGSFSTFRAKPLRYNIINIQTA